MHRYKIVAQITLILSILNLVLAAPIVVQEIHEARSDDGEMVAPEDSGESEAAPDQPTSPPSGSSPGAMTPPQHSTSPVGSTSLNYHLSSGSSVSGYSWLADRLPRPTLSPNYPSPHTSQSGPSEMPRLALLQGLASPQHSSSGSSIPSWVQELEERFVREWLGWPGLELSTPQHVSVATTATYSPSDKFTLSHGPSSMSSEPSTQYASASDGALSDYFFSASDGSEPPHDSISMLEGFEPSDGPPTETPPENAEFFNKNMMKKLTIAAGVLVVGGAIAGIAGSQIKHHEHRDCQDS